MHGAVHVQNTHACAHTLDTAHTTSNTHPPPVTHTLLVTHTPTHKHYNAINMKLKLV